MSLIEALEQAERIEAHKKYIRNLCRASKAPHVTVAMLNAAMKKIIPCGGMMVCVGISQVLAGIQAALRAAPKPKRRRQTKKRPSCWPSVGD